MEIKYEVVEEWFSGRAVANDVGFAFLVCSISCLLGTLAWIPAGTLRRISEGSRWTSHSSTTNPVSQKDTDTTMRVLLVFKPQMHPDLLWSPCDMGYHLLGFSSPHLHAGYGS